MRLHSFDFFSFIFFLCVFSNIIYLLVRLILFISKKKKWFCYPIFDLLRIAIKVCALRKKKQKKTRIVVEIERTVSMSAA